MWSNLTTKRGDSGSAGLLERKCVIIGAHKLVTKSDQNQSPTRKMTKNDQKSQNRKSDKIKKMQKVKKSTKQKNGKSEKVIKFKSSKNDKKNDKNWPPLKKAKMSLKWPKSPLCVFRAAWLGTFSIPGGTTGPGFKAEIRPPLFFTFFDVFKLAFSCFYHFAFYHFSSFLHFHVFCIWSILMFFVVLA